MTRTIAHHAHEGMTMICVSDFTQGSPGGRGEDQGREPAVKERNLGAQHRDARSGAPLDLLGRLTPQIFVDLEHSEQPSLLLRAGFRTVH